PAPPGHLTDHVEDLVMRNMNLARRRSRPLGICPPSVLSTRPKPSSDARFCLASWRHVANRGSPGSSALLLTPFGCAALQFSVPALARIFRELAQAERLHRDEILRLGGGADVAGHAREVAKWKRGESPEVASLDAAHYLMMPWHALQMALDAEKRALDFFASV